MQKKEGSSSNVEISYNQQRSKSVARDADQGKCHFEKYSICERFYPQRSLSRLHHETWKSECWFDRQDVTVDVPDTSRSSCRLTDRERLLPDDPLLVRDHIIACNRSNNTNLEIDSRSKWKKYSATRGLLLPFNIVRACDQVIKDAIQNHRRCKQMAVVNKIPPLDEIVMGRRGGHACSTAGYKLCPQIENQWVMMPEVLPLHGRITSEKPPQVKNWPILMHHSTLPQTKTRMPSYIYGKSRYKAPHAYISEKNLSPSSPRTKAPHETPEGSSLPPPRFSPHLSSALPPLPAVSLTLSSALSPALPSTSNKSRYDSEIVQEKAGPQFTRTASYAKAKEKACVKLNVISVGALKRGYGPWFLSSTDSGTSKTHKIRRLLASETFQSGSSPSQRAWTYVSKTLAAPAGKRPGKENKKEANPVPLTVYPIPPSPPMIPLCSADTGRQGPLRFFGRVEGVLYPQNFVPKRNPNSAMPNTVIVELRIPSPKL